MTEPLTELLVLAKGGDRDAAGRLVTENSGLIWSVVKRFLGRGSEADDLYQLGCIGFLKAVEGYDPDYGTRFSTYAVPKIAGEIRRFLRDDGAIKVSRTLKERSAAVKAARQRLCHRLGREPAVTELAAETGLTAEEIACAETATSAAESIQKQCGEDGLALEDLLTAGDMEQSLLERMDLRAAVAGLPEKERRVVALRFFHGLTQDRAARIVGVSQVQISRIEKKALAHLRESL